MQTITITITVPPKPSLMDRLRGRVEQPRCPYCGETDVQPATHINAGRCRDQWDDGDGDENL